MEIQKKVTKTITQESLKFMHDKKFKEFSEYYKKLKEAGIAKKEEYSIPLIKTVGPQSF